MIADADPFAALSFIAGPALLTNASSLLLLGTINRYARALDRARALAQQLSGGAAVDAGERAFLSRQLRTAERRVLLIVRSLTVFYAAIGAFGLGTLTYLVGATLLAGTGGERVASAIMLGASTLGVLCLISGAAALVWESRLSYRILVDEAELALRRAEKAGQG
jgi:hypothetical protein